MLIPEVFIVDVGRLFLCAETIGIDIDDDGCVVEGIFDGLFDIHCSIVFEWIFCWIYESRNSGCSTRYVLTASAVNASELAEK